jgi:hypothetical protein
MGRTLATFTQLIDEERERWQKFRRALRKEDQTVLDDLFGAARYHSAAGAYVAQDLPFETIVMCMLLEEHKMLLALQQKVKELEEKFAHH